MTDHWAWYKAWDAKLNPPVSDGIVQNGFFRTSAGKAGGFSPVAIWRDPDGSFKCRVGTKAAHRYVDETMAADRWTFICKNPVKRDEYKVAWETGTWPDGAPTVAPDLTATVKSNAPSDPFEALQAEIADKIASAEAWAKAHPEAKTQTEADYATNLRREIAALLKQADAMHAAEKAPILAAEKATDEKFRFRDKMKSVGVILKGIYERFLVSEEAKAKAAAQAKFEAERRATEIAREEMRKAQERKMRDDPVAALTDPEPELPQLPMGPAPVKVNSGGGVGSRAGLKTDYVGVIEDYNKAFDHFRSHPDMKAELERLVKAAVRAGKSETKIPGVTVKEVRKVAA